jgi:hypothetical protein
MNKTLYLALLILLYAVSTVIAMGGGGAGGSQKTIQGLEGRITDANGKTLSGVEVSLTQLNSTELEQAKSSSEQASHKPFLTQSNGSGRYRFVAVRAGVYRIRFTMDGYQTLEKLLEFRRGSRDAVLNIELRPIEQQIAGPAAAESE